MATIAPCLVSEQHPSELLDVFELDDCGFFAGCLYRYVLKDGPIGARVVLVLLTLLVC